MKHDAAHHAKWVRVALLAAFIGGLVAFFVLGGHRWLTLDALKAHRDALLQFTAQHYGAMLAAALLIYAGAVALSVPGASILSLALGLLFGRWIGTLAIVAAATAGATLVFLAARYLFADVARRRFGARINRLIGGFQRDAFNYLLFLRLVPLFPFWLVNLVPAFTAVPTRTYVAATFIGIIPGSFVFANLGASLGRIESTADLLSPTALAAFFLLGVFALVPVVVKKRRGSPARRPSAPHIGHDV